ncbi:MAG TPA: tRNA (adenosine(37)-N6)-threonylcarbamoyltransferase complex ATPase subunit type 1 TsaE [Gemmatimonadales bacterium]
MTSPLTEAGLTQLGHRLGRSLPSGAVVWLEGPLGAGKTTLVRAILESRAPERAVTSPTFNLVHRHEGRQGAAFHVDCYRLRHPAEAAELDWSEMLGADLLLIEWPDRGGCWVPSPTLRIQLDHASQPDQRTVSLDPPLGNDP